MASVDQRIFSDDWTPPSAQVAGQAFVHEYYKQLISSPHRIQEFYRYQHDRSSFSVDDDYLTAMNKRVTAMDTVESLESYLGGLTVLVTGIITGQHDVRRHRFTQSFILGRQQGGYILINDLFHYTGQDRRTAPAAAAATKAPLVPRPAPANGGTSTIEHAAPEIEVSPNQIISLKECTTALASELSCVSGDEAEECSGGRNEEDVAASVGTNRLHSAVGQLQKLFGLPVTDEENMSRSVEQYDNVIMSELDEDHDYVLIIGQLEEQPLLEHIR
ncbi:hypothetical protein EJB05_27777 [Eragrostis curvula]|uniref:NTF2 domain-containing protein n=1 Tax=Eragrostis curvula TaxID=38414 RepID=A0A5J9UP89_9POAL|nr:hypothetical protein EJB05_27777 [Eragrostis curvula]